MRRLTVASIVALLCVGCAQTDSQVARARALSNWSSVESMTDLRAASAPTLQATIDQGGGPHVMAQSITEQLGAEQSVIDETTLTLNGLTMYQRLGRFERAPSALSQLVIGADGLVHMAVVRPPPEIEPTSDAVPETPLKLPFGAPRQGEWLTFWGGDNVARNYHVVQPAQRYAYDFLVVRDGATYSGAADANASYYCWNEPILAPAAGRVARAVNTIPDNAVGAMNADAPEGNHVVIEHDSGEQSLLAHLQQGSVAVSEGQHVASGDVIGRCGNSGNSSEPHLHYHLQTSDGARGLPAPFRDYEADGQRVTLGRPVRGEVVSAER